MSNQKQTNKATFRHISVKVRLTLCFSLQIRDFCLFRFCCQRGFCLLCLLWSFYLYNFLRLISPEGWWCGCWPDLKTPQKNIPGNLIWQYNDTECDTDMNYNFCQVSWGVLGTTARCQVPIVFFFWFFSTNFGICVEEKFNLIIISVWCYIWYYFTL